MAPSSWLWLKSLFKLQTFHLKFFTLISVVCCLGHSFYCISWLYLIATVWTLLFHSVGSLFILKILRAMPFSVSLMWKWKKVVSLRHEFGSVHTVKSTSVRIALWSSSKCCSFWLLFSCDFLPLMFTQLLISFSLGSNNQELRASERARYTGSHRPCQQNTLGYRNPHRPLNEILFFFSPKIVCSQRGADLEMVSIA